MGAPQVPFGRAMRQAHFGISPHYTPLNHGSFGTIPLQVTAANNAIRAELESNVDPFIFFKTPEGLARGRELVSEILNSSPSEVVFVTNATTGIDTVFKNIVWEKGDVVLCYEVLYGAVARGLAWLEETRGIEIEKVPIQWPVGDDQLIQIYVETVKRINSEGKGKRRVRLAICDTIVSMPGMRVPFEKLVPALQKEGTLVLVDGAHGIGHIDIDLSALKPDFFVTNLHKWLYVPRGCAAFYVPERHQHMIKTSLPTSMGYQPIYKEGEKPFANPLPAAYENKFIEMFDYTGTMDNTNCFCVPAALKFRQEVCGGEQAIRSYCESLAYEAGNKIADMFGTEVFDHPNSRIRECAFANIRLPLKVGYGDGEVKPNTAPLIQNWLKATGAKESGVYFQVQYLREFWWWRISGQIYVELDDFLRGAKVLLKLCERAKRGEHERLLASL